MKPTKAAGIDRNLIIDSALIEGIYRAGEGIHLA
jgi:hypothetical protein